VETHRHGGTTTKVGGGYCKRKKKGKVARGRDLSARISFSSFSPFPFSSTLFLFLSSDLKQMTGLLQVQRDSVTGVKTTRIYIFVRMHSFMVEFSLYASEL